MCVKGVWGNGVTFPQRFFASFLASKKGRYFVLLLSRQQNSPTIFRKNKSAPLGGPERSGIFVVLLCYVKKLPGDF